MFKKKMTLLEIIILVMSIPLASLYLSTISIYRIAFLIILYSSLLSYNTLYLITLSSDIGILGGLFQTPQLFKIPINILGDFSLIEESNILFSMFVPIMIYSNAELDKLKVLADNKGKAGIYQWTHNVSNKIYIGSAVDLSKRFRCYYSKSYLTRCSNSHIYNALLCHGYSAFSLTILEHIDVSGLSKEEVRLLILSREQFYLDSIFLGEDKPNSYNLLPTAGTLLGYKHTDESKVLMSEAKSGENHPMFGNSHSAESLVLMSLAKNKMVFVYSFNSETKETILFKSFDSCSDTSKFFDCSSRTLSRYLDKNKLYKEKWILSSSLITKK